MNERWERARTEATAYVLRAGDPLERLRARVLAGDAPAAEVVKALAEAGALSGSDAEAFLRALAVLDDLGQLGARELEPGVIAAAAALGEDGAWGEPARPLDRRIVETAMLGGYLTKTLRLRPRVRDAIDGFLCRTWSPDRVKTGAWEPIAAYAHWFSLTDSELSDAALQWCGRELERGFRTRSLDAVAVARVYVLCDALALPGASLTAAELCEALAKEQTKEGGFSLSARALAGEPVAAALDAIRAFAHLGPAGAAP